MYADTLNAISTLRGAGLELFITSPKRRRGSSCWEQGEEEKSPVRVASRKEAVKRSGTWV